jgi:tetratricopeptide (TPR) repeat protein
MRRVLSDILLVCFFLCGLLACVEAGAEAGTGGGDGSGNGTAQDLSVGASRALYEAQRLMDRKEYEKASRILESFAEKHPEQSNYLVEFSLANALFLGNRKEESLARYRASVDKNPAFGPAWVNLGQVAYDLKRYGLAAEALEEGFARAEEGAQEKKSPDLLYYAAVAHILDVRPEKAAPILEELVSGKHGDPDREWFQALVNIYLDTGQDKKAEQLIERMVERYGDRQETWRLSYQFEAHRRNYRKAAVAMTVYSYLKPLTREEAILLGDLYATIQVPLLASVYYESALASGASPEEYERLASVYLSAHRLDEAHRTLKEALRKEPTPNLWSLLGDLNYMEGDFEGAYYAFEESARLDSRDGRAYLMMGTCAVQTKRERQAVEALEKAKGFPKQRKHAVQLLESLE